jgi:peptidoglycan hydrolase-like protein with peptidoglycan-binding domain
VPVGSVASWRGGALPDGAYYWRASAEDLVGNQSAWSAPAQFVVDNVAPSVPATPAPDNGAVVKTARLTGTFRSDDASDGGRLAFQVCADADCTNVVAGGTSGSVTASAVAATLGATTFSATGSAASWTAGNLPDGSYFWRVRAEDVAGNSSDWSSTQSFTLIRTPPSKPRAFSATADGGTLTLSWRSPAAGVAIAGYALLVNGRTIQILDPDTLSVRLRLLGNDKRSFAIAAVDGAGNIGAPTTIFVPSTQTAVKQAQARTKPPLPAPARKPRRT